MHDNSYSINDVNIEINSFQFSDKKHQELVKKDLSDHALDLNKALRDEENRNLVISEMFIESAVLQAISRDMCSTLGHWDYVTHQLIASPFKPLSYIDKIDIYGYRYSQHYQDAPNLVVKYLIVELKKGKINTAALKRIRRINPFGEYLITNRGKRIRSNTLNKRLETVCEACGVLVHSTHKIRKTYGTTLLDARVEDSIVADQMGHKDVTTTRKLYYYCNKDRDTKLAQVSGAITY